MPGIALASAFQPDFGVPYPRRWREQFDALDNDGLQALGEIKAALDSDQPVDLAGFPPDVRAQATRMVAEQSAKSDPVSFGWTLESWREVMENWKKYRAHICLGGNRAAKSVFAARLVVWLLQNIPECRIRCYQVNDEKSITEQQAYIHDALPDSLKHLPRKRGSVHSIEFSQKNGFTGGKLILPPVKGATRGGECIFGTYQQYRNDPQIVEGFWVHFVWLDEECEVKMFDRLLQRALKDADGRLLLTFTTIKGWTPLIEDLLGKTQTLRKRFAPLLNLEIPVAQLSLRRNATRIYYFWSEDNPFLPPGHMDSFKSRPEAEIKATAYGIPSKSATSIFTAFSEEAHVVKHADIPFLKPAPPEGEPDTRPHVTWYHIIDPAGDKPWFMLWAAVDARRQVYIVEEWPDQSYGTWGEAGPSPEGLRGSAQRSQQYDIQDYIDTMKYVEDKYDAVPYERIIDSRLGNTPTLTLNGAITYQTQLEDAGIIVVSAPGNVIHHGLDLIKAAMKWDNTKPLSTTNCPRLRISDNCQNTIECMKNYAKAHMEEVWKDPIDCLRYLFEAGADYVETTPTETTKTASYGSGGY